MYVDELPFPFLPSLTGSHTQICIAIGVQDVGGKEAAYAAIDRSRRDVAYWEKRVHATLWLLSYKRLITADELRRGIEAISPSTYEEASYYSLRPPVLIVKNRRYAPAGRLLRGVWPSTMYNDHAL
jgi:hypothetical protein